MSSQAVMKRQILALAKREPSNEELQKIKQSLAVYKKLTKEEQTKINEMVNDAHAKLDSEGKFAKGGKTKTQSMKTALTEFKNKIGVKKFKRATTGTDIKKDIAIPALKVGKRIVRKKGKTTNQYGTFKNQVGTTYYEGRPNRSDVNQPSEKRKIKLAKGGEVGDRYYASIFTHNQNVEPYISIKPQYIITNTKEEMVEKLNELYEKTFSQNYSPYEIIDFDEKYAINGTYISDDWAYVTNNIERFKEHHKNDLEDFNEKSNKKQTHAKGGEVSQYIDGLSKQEVLSKSIVYDNGGESYDRYTIFTPDGSVYGMSETAEGFNQYLGDSSEIEKGKHLGRKLRSVPKGIQGAVLDRMLDDEQMFAKGGKLSKEDALQKAIDMGVDFDKDFHAQSVGNELAELAKESGYKKSASSSGSTGRAFFYHLQKIYDAKVLANHKQTMRNAPFDENTYPKGTEFAKGGEIGVNTEVILTENKPNGLKFRGIVNPFMLKSIEDNQYSGGFKRYEIDIYDEVDTDPSKEDIEKANEFFDKVGGRYSKGGKLSSKAKYIPKRDIAEIEVEKNGKSKSIDGANLLDGVYVKKGTKFAQGGMMNANEHFRLRGLEFLKDDLAQLQQAVQDNNQEEIQKFFSYWGQHLEMLKTTNNERMFSFLQDDLMKLENDIEEKNQKEIEKFFSYWGYHLESLKYAKGGTIKKSLAEFKNKVGASKYREATRGVDIKADLQIPALKKGRRVVTTKGKTSNQYGTFKNQVGSVYYENRPNHYDVNQPSEKRKIKLADGGQTSKIVREGSELLGYEPYFEKNVTIAFIDDSKKVVTPTHGYYPNHPLSKKAISWAKRNGYQYMADGKKYAEGGTFADGGVLEGAEIYVADLAEYNNGRLVGKHLKLSDYSSGAEVMEAIQEILDEQTAKDKFGEVHEEYAIHDFEGFPRSFYHESMGEKDFDKLYQIAEVANDRGIPIDVLMEAVADFGADEDQIEAIADAYYSSVPSSMGNESRDFAYEYIDSIGSITDAVSNPDFYFDYESFGSDARMDYSDEDLEEYGYDELDDTELGERLVDEMGGIEQVGDKTIEMYFDYDRFGRDLEQDFISVKGDDGDYYFFNRNW